MINWGIIGLGRMANQFANSITEVKNAKLIGVASKSEERLKTFGDNHKIDKKFRFKSYEEILSCDEINSIYIATLNNTHAELVINAALKKKNILCEKPVCTSYTEVLKIFDALNKSNVFFSEAIAYLLHPQTQFIINKIYEGEIGDVKTVDSTCGFFNSCL